MHVRAAWCAAVYMAPLAHLVPHHLSCPSPQIRRHFTLHDKLQHPGVPLNTRLLIMALLTTVWGARLTFNFARKGGYRFDAEDYRWGLDRVLLLI